MSTNTIQGQGTNSTVTIAAGTANSTLTGNQISNNSSTGGSALVVSSGEVINMSTNTIQNQSDVAPTVNINGVVYCTVTGNTILNPPVGVKGVANPTQSISITPSGLALVAVTGNVLLGSANLPPCSGFPPPIDTWNAFNTIIVTGSQ